MSLIFKLAGDCGSPPHPENGNVTLNQNGTLIGSSATYTCDLNYSLIGVGTIVCQSNREWSGSAKCVGVLRPLCWH